MRFGAWPLVVVTLAPPFAEQAIAQDCRPTEVPGKHGTLNNYRVPFNGDGKGNGISHSIWVKFRMFDDGRIEAPLTYDNDSKEPFCGGVHIRLGDINNNPIAEFYSDPGRCVDGRPLISLGGGAIQRTYAWNLQTTSEVACRYAHLHIVPNRDHAEASATSSPSQSSGGTTVKWRNGSLMRLYVYYAIAPQTAVIDCDASLRPAGDKPVPAPGDTWQAYVGPGQQGWFRFQTTQDGGCPERNNKFDSRVVGFSAPRSETIDIQ